MIQAEHVTLGLTFSLDSSSNLAMPGMSVRVPKEHIPLVTGAMFIVYLK
jgi:hypothetical protein